MYHISDIPQWAEHRLSDNEVPLSFVADKIGEGTGRFELRQSKQVPNSWALWDAETDTVAVVTHAFIIRWTSPLETGNYVPEGKSKPDNLTEGSRRSEPGPNVQLSVAFDCKSDDTVHRSLAIIEKWAESIPRFNPDRVPRSQWMTPSWIASNGKMIVTSQLFSIKTPFNNKKGAPEIPYEVHPWISSACAHSRSTWIPNPSRVLFYDAQDGVLESLSSSSDPSLQKGDLVKMTFRFVFTSGRTYWHCAIKPLQIIRVGHIASLVYGSTAIDEEPVGLQLPQPGAKITLLQRQSSPTSEGHDDIDEADQPLDTVDGEGKMEAENVVNHGEEGTDLSELTNEDSQQEGKPRRATRNPRNTTANSGTAKKRKSGNDVAASGKSKKRKV